MLAAARRASLLIFLAACNGRAPDVVLYCAVDAVHSEPIVRAFEEATGLVVDFQPDVEASKSVGHRRRIQEEASRPRCDVFWNNEVVQTVLLAQAGLLEPYASPSAQDVPSAYRDPAWRWTGFAARARVLIVNTESFPGIEGRPDSTEDFLLSAHAGRCGMARPLTGTTAAHAGVWLGTWGEEQTFALLDAMRANDVRFGPGNAQVMQLVRRGELSFGWTDTDDVRAALEDGYPVAQVLPDQGAQDLGLVVIPNTVSIVKGAPHPEAARRLVDFLLGRETEALLAAGPSAQIPLRDGVPRPAHVLDLSSVRVAPADWAAVGQAYSRSADALEAFFHQ